jgi:radical SAM superfamily enzyme YgiQ (UPF0313 family)
MKVVIVSLNSQYIHSSLAPWYLLASVKESCPKEIKAKVIEGTVNENIEEVYKRIKKEKADIIAFSCYIWNITYVMSLVELLYQKGVKIVLGGPEVSYCPENILSNHMVNYVLSGEGELPFATLLNTIIKKGTLKNVPGLSYRYKGKNIIGQPFITDEIPVNPYSKEYFKALKGRIAYIETSRGCPFSCAFCLSGRCGGVRFFPLDRALNDIITLSNSGSKIIKFVDRTFNANRKRAYEIFSFIIDNYGKCIPADVCFHFEIAGDLLRKEDFELLKTAPKGAIQFEIGMQSFNGETLKAINRKTNVKLLKENIKKLTEMGNIHIHIDLIAGLPKEDYKSFRDSFNTAFSLKANMLQLGFLKLLYGADMREKSEDYPCEYYQNPPYEVVSTPYINKMQMDMLHSCENALERFVNSGRFKLTNEYIFNVQKRNPFDTLSELGMFTLSDSCSLNEYVNRLYWYFEKGSDSSILRDALLCDIAVSVKSNVLPKSLIREDKRLRKFRQILESNEDTKRKKGVMRNTFLLYSQNCGAYVDYDEKIDGKYVLKKIKFDIN